MSWRGSPANSQNSLAVTNRPSTGERDRPASGGNVPWPVAVSFLIRPLPDDFTLPDVYAIADPLRGAFPNNKHVEAKIRQSLQILRDRGEIAFEGGGRYRKVPPA